MRSYFKKPDWATNSGTTGTDFYRRSEQTYADIIAAEREAHRKLKPPSESPEDTTSRSDRTSKRPRLSDEVGSEAADAADGDQPLEAVEPGEQHRQSSSPPKRGASEEDDELPKTPSFGPLKTCRLDGPSPSPPDNGALLNSHVRNQSPSKRDLRSSDTIQKDATRPSNPPAASLPAGPSPTAIPDPIVQILITSQIPGTRPLVVHRKMSQSLREVRVEWCKRQGLTTELQSSVYLTWKGRRLFDVTTCRSLGIRLESKLDLSDGDYGPDVGLRELRIHMEAVTDNPLLLNRPGSSPDEGQAHPVTSSPEEETSEPIKLILRSPGMDDFRIKARPKTLVSKLISVFRDRRGIKDGQDVSLLFDGDRLDPSACLRDYDIADLDMVDVQVKQRS